MRIAIIFDFLRGGGAQYVAGMLSKYLDKTHQVYLLLKDTKNIVYQYGGVLVNVGCDGEDYIEDNVRKAKRKYKIDVSISHMEFFNHINISTRVHDRIIIVEHSCQFHRLSKEYLIDFKDMLLYRNADHAVAVSEGVKQELLEMPGMRTENISVIYNFFDAQNVRKQSQESVEYPKELEKWIKDGCRLITTIGRLVEEKDHIKLIRQFGKCIAKDNKLRLVIIGGGYAEDRLHSEIKELGLTESICITGYMPNPFPILKLADLFVLSSLVEGYGNVILEAMTLRIPVVAVDCFAGPREILDDNSNYDEKINGWKKAKRGILVGAYDSDRDGSTQYLEDAMSAALNDLSMRKEFVDSSERWIDELSADVIYRRWIDCIDKCLYDKTLSETLPYKVVHGKHYLIYGAGEYARKIYADLQNRGYMIDAFVVTDSMDEKKLFGKPIYKRDYLLNEGRHYEIILGIANFEYANQVCEWFITNGIYHVLFYGLSKQT